MAKRHDDMLRLEIGIDLPFVTRGGRKVIKKNRIAITRDGGKTWTFWLNTPTNLMIAKSFLKNWREASE